MAEAIHCPSCTTRYRLRPERLKPVIRRAKCVSCSNVFPLGEVVQRLLALPEQASTAAFRPDYVAAVQQEEAAPTQAEVASLSPADLEGTDSEILEKTLVAFPSSLPEAKAEAAGGYTSEVTETTMSGYTSARDAIEKLFGSAPAPASGLKVSSDANPTDMEATLSALDSTLGTPSAKPSTSPAEAHGDIPTAAGLNEEDLAGSSTSTMRLSQKELLAAIASAPPPTPSEPTVALRASDLVSAREEQAGKGAASPATRPFPALLDSQDGSAEMLRLKIGEDIYGGLTMPQLISWVEEGRILENHLIARQHSENWLEAHKVPGLRPVFERLRRERTGVASGMDSSQGEIAPRRASSAVFSERTKMQTLLLIAALGLLQEPPLQIPPPPAEAPAQQSVPLPAPAPAPLAKAPPTAPPAPAAVTAAPLTFYSETFPYTWDRVIPLTISLDGLKVNSIFFNKRVLNLLKDTDFGTRAQVEVTNTGKSPKIPGFAVAVLDKDGRLLGVASGGTRVGTIKPGETETFDLNFTHVKERLVSGEKFLLSIELKN